MGLLDWLNEAMGGSGDIVSGGNPMQPGPSPTMMNPLTGQDEPRRHVPSQPTQPMPPMLMTGDNVPPMDLESSMGAGPPPGVMLPPGGDPMTAGQPPGAFPPAGDPMTAGNTAAPSPPFPPGGDPMVAGGVPPGGPGLPRPAPAALPPNAAPTAGAPPPPGPPMDIGSGINGVGPGMGVGTLDQLRGSPQAHGIIGRALGIDANREAQIRGSLGAGLKAAGENSHKPGLAAFAGSAGAGIEGGKKADDTTIAQQDKYLQRAIQAKREGNHAEYQKNYLQYQIAATKEKLAVAKEKAATGSGSVMNSPEQLYLRAVGATNSDGNLKILNNAVTEARKQFGADSKQAQAATEAYEKRYKEVRDGHLSTLKVDPGQIKALEGKPGFSDKNPVKEFPKDPAAAQKAFDALPDGAYFINPKDGRLLTKKAAGGGGAANPAQSDQQSALTPPMPPMPLDPNQAEAA